MSVVVLKLLSFWILALVGCASSSEECSVATADASCGDVAADVAEHETSEDEANSMKTSLLQHRRDANEEEAKRSTWFFDPDPTPSPVFPVTSVSHPKVGVGFSIKLQKNGLDVETAARKLASAGVQTVRLWDYDSKTLDALQKVGIKDVLVDVPNGEVYDLSKSDSKATGIAKMLKPYVDGGMTIRIGISNEPLALWNLGLHRYNLAPAMENMISALHAHGLNSVKVTVPFSEAILTSSYPPENGKFARLQRSAVRDIAAIINRTGSEFTFHVYPFFARKINPWQVGLDTAVGRAEATVSGKTYSGTLGLIVAAFRAALIKLDPTYEAMPINIGESGWPSAGHGDASTENACDYARHFFGSARSTDKPLDPYLTTAYYFEAFDEQTKSLTGSEENYFGLFSELGDPKCENPPINFS